MTRLLKLSEVKIPGWYVCFLLDDPTPIESFRDLDEAISGTSTFMVELDGEGVWRSSTGHGITLEQPDYFGGEGEAWFVGPLNL